jgi:aminopeptidase
MATITELPKISLSFNQKLDRLAQVAVNVGLGLERGQELVMTAALDSLPLARLITEQAYKPEPHS